MPPIDVSLDQVNPTSQESLLQPLQCNICLNLSYPDPVRLPCGHIFHQSCIVPWLKSTRICPTCKMDLSTPSIPFSCDFLTLSILKQATFECSDEKCVFVGTISQIKKHKHVTAIEKQRLERIDAKKDAKVPKEPIKQVYILEKESDSFPDDGGGGLYTISSNDEDSSDSQIVDVKEESSKESEEDSTSTESSSSIPFIVTDEPLDMTAQRPSGSGRDRIFSEVETLSSFFTEFSSIFSGSRNRASEDVRSNLLDLLHSFLSRDSSSSDSRSESDVSSPSSSSDLYRIPSTHQSIRDSVHSTRVTGASSTGRVLLHPPSDPPSSSVPSLNPFASAVAVHPSLFTGSLPSSAPVGATLPPLSTLLPTISEIVSSSAPVPLIRSTSPSASTVSFDVPVSSISIGDVITCGPTVSICASTRCSFHPSVDPHDGITTSSNPFRACSCSSTQTDIISPHSSGISSSGILDLIRKGVGIVVKCEDIPRSKVDTSISSEIYTWIKPNSEDDEVVIPSGPLHVAHVYFHHSKMCVCVTGVVKYKFNGPTSSLRMQQPLHIREATRNWYSGISQVVSWVARIVGIRKVPFKILQSSYHPLLDRHDGFDTGQLRLCAKMLLVKRSGDSAPLQILPNETYGFQPTTLFRGSPLLNVDVAAPIVYNLYEGVLNESSCSII
ncbi:hypothetical protein ADUPG1_009649 [Aduncisulcus paluster]|uniref:RING-type domain-containing protein n=1 Tax=Aduncisulcus paluster TaxID=2918883 RepID=A0ABQ5KWB2_9EUKA|nr:hypothetical protein ADUPG1_009649 [Aduncisulcus paluster]